MVRNKIKSNMRIPVVMDVVVPGNPDLKVTSNADDLSAEQNLKRRIADVEQAIGQDEMTRLGRAHAIRSETALLD